MPDSFPDPPGSMKAGAPPWTLYVVYHVSDGIRWCQAEVELLLLAPDGEMKLFVRRVTSYSLLIVDCMKGQKYLTFVD